MVVQAAGGLESVSWMRTGFNIYIYIYMLYYNIYLYTYLIRIRPDLGFRYWGLMHKAKMVMQAAGGLGSVSWMKTALWDAACASSKSLPTSRTPLLLQVSSCKLYIHMYVHHELYHQYIYTYVYFVSCIHVYVHCQ